MYIVVFIIIIFIIVCIIGSKTGKQESIPVKSERSKLQEIENRRTKKYKRYARLLRHKHIWAVLRLMKEFELLQASENFYDVNKTVASFDKAKKRLYEDDFTPTEEDITTAIRFCLYQNTTGKCDYCLSQKDIDRIYDWRNFSYDGYEILSRAGNSFKDYWDDVITNYKRQADKNKRKKYLVEHLNEMKEKDMLKHIPHSNELFDDLIKYYS